MAWYTTLTNNVTPTQTYGIWTVVFFSPMNGILYHVIVTYRGLVDSEDISRQENFDEGETEKAYPHVLNY